MKLARMQFITHFTDRYSYYDSAVLALEGGCRWIQLRMKDASADELESTARRILPLCRSCGAVFIVDDNLDVALRTGADGVHLGKNDMPVDEARRLAGDGFIIGGTANTFDDVCRLVSQGADYIGCGPFRFTSTKKNLSPVLGLEGYRDIVARMRRGGIGIPLVAIGGIACGDIAEILGTGVSGIALSGSVLRADDPVSEMRRVADTVTGTTENIHNDIWTTRSE
ncbi:MAG TPA: thiamine phosphate synthase [Candidatus Cryptobacteroides pullicola]|nr:thiamine phosphate synthase [Candidatus Cryptobacteroides pullicola]